MLDEKSKIRNRDIEIQKRSVEVYFFDKEGFSASLEVPSPEELDVLRDAAQLKLSPKGLQRLQDPFGLRARQEEELNRKLDKYHKYSDSSTYLVRLANLTENMEGSSAAHSYLKRASQIDTDITLKHELGENLVSQDEFLQAEELFHDCDLSHDVYANLRIGSLLILQNKINEAEEYVLRALDIDPCSHEAQMFEGTICLSRGHAELAVRRFKTAAEDHPNSAPLFVNLAAAYWMIKQRKQALDALRKAVLINPLNINAVLFYADAAFIEGKFSLAIPSLEKYLEWDSHEDLAWSRLARAQFHIGRENKDANSLGSAFESIKKLVVLAPNVSVWNNMGVITWRQKNNTQAAKYFNYAMKMGLKEKQDFKLPLYNLMGLLIENRLYENAEKYLPLVSGFEETHEDNENVLEKILLQRVIVLEGLGKREEAIIFAHDLLERDPKSPDVRMELLLNLTYHYATTEPNLELIESYRKKIFKILKSGLTIDVNTKNRAINNLIFALFLFEKNDQAIELLPMLSAQFHKEPYSTATLGLSYIVRGDVRRGEKLYAEAISLLEDSKMKNRFRQRLYFELGKKDIKEGNRASGIRFFEKALKQRGGYDYVSRDIKQIKKSLSHLQ